MAKLEVKNIQGKKVGDVELDEAVFGVEVNEHLLWEVVKMQRAKTRSGTAKVKGRSEVRGGGKKPYKQKGTGNARQGSTRSPNFVGGGSVFGPRPRDYEYTMPKKAVAGALRSVLSLKAKEQKLVIVENFDLTAIKTKSVAAALKALGTGKSLIVDSENEKLQKSTRNLPKAKYLRPEGLNVYDVLNHEALILTRGSVEKLTARLKPVVDAADAAEGVA